MTQFIKRCISWCMIVVLAFSLLPTATLFAGEAEMPVLHGVKKTFYYEVKSEPKSFVDEITAVKNGDRELAEASSKYLIKSSNYFVDRQSKTLNLYFPKASDLFTLETAKGSYRYLFDGENFVAQSFLPDSSADSGADAQTPPSGTGSTEGDVSSDGNHADEGVGGSTENDSQGGSTGSESTDIVKVAPVLRFEEKYGYPYAVFTTPIREQDLVAVKRDMKELKKGSFLPATRYSLEKSKGSSELVEKIKFGEFAQGNVLTLVFRDGAEFYYAFDGENFTTLHEKPKEKVLHVKLEGSFSHAVISQKKYDGISGASGSIKESDNKGVQLLFAFLEEGTDPKESDWKSLHTLGYGKYEAEPFVTGSGTKVQYSSYDGKIEFIKLPSEVGIFEVAFDVTYEGRTKRTNSLPVMVYSENEKLSDHMLHGNMGTYPDGSYKWDMVPWTIPHLSESGEFTVPSGKITMFGTHVAGSYGVLGQSREAAGEQRQTLRITDGTDLNMVHVLVLDNVRIVVENGGILRLHGSSIGGEIVVKDGGRLTVDYDERNGVLIGGTPHASSLNGQIILEEGAKLGPALIRSMTNHAPDKRYESQNTEPVVKVTGNASLLGEVYIRGDEAPQRVKFGKKLESGQPALAVEHATLTLESGGKLAVFGGGYERRTTEGASALVLENGTIRGGTLLAVAGVNRSDAGKVAVAGTGSLETEKLYLRGGHHYPPYHVKEGVVGKAHDETVKVFGGNVTDGQVFRGSLKATDHADFWKTDTEKPWELEAPVKETGVEIPKVPQDTVVKFAGKLENATFHLSSNQPDVIAQVSYVKVDKTNFVREQDTRSTHKFRIEGTVLKADCPQIPEEGAKVLVTARGVKYHFTFVNGRLNGTHAYEPAPSTGGIVGGVVDTTDSSSSSGSSDSMQNHDSQSGASKKNDAGNSQSDATKEDKRELDVETEAVPLSAVYKAYEDLSDKAWYREAVDFVLVKSLMKGSSGKFAPMESLTRAGFIELLFHREGSPDVVASATAHSFDDVSADATYKKALDWASNKKMTSEFGASFRANTVLTREEAIRILWKYFGSKASRFELHSYKDMLEITSGIEEAIRWAVETKVIQGYQQKLMPTKELTKAEMAQILKNISGRNVKEQ